MYSKIKVHLNSLIRLDFKVSSILLLELIFYKVVNTRLLKYFLNKNFKNKLEERNQILEFLFSEVKKIDNIYSTAYFFKGINVGAPWLISHGYGRWKFLLEKHLIQIIKNKNILDLGSNSGILPLYMLHSGAKSVTAVELLNSNIDLINCYKSVLESTTKRSFKLNIHNSDMMEVINFDPSRYDLVTAFCSLYYLTEENLIVLMKWVFKNIGIIVIQANDDSSVDVRNEKAKLTYLREVAEKVGFVIYREIRPKNYYRPMLIACSPNKLNTIS